MNQHQIQFLISTLKRLREGRILQKKNRKLSAAEADAILEFLTILAPSRRRVRSRRVLATHLSDQPRRPYENN